VYHFGLESHGAKIRKVLGVLWRGRFRLNMEISVKLEHDSTVKGVARFRTTRWTVVMISAQSQAREGRAAFAELYQLYRYPLYAFARRGGHSPEDAQESSTPGGQ
jgi:hypothetical protein